MDNPLKGVTGKIPKNAWIVAAALGVGYLLYRNIHRN